MTRRIQQLIDVAVERHEAGARAESPPLRREHAATSRSPTASGARARKDKEPAASHSRTRITIERDAEGRPRAVERQGNPPPPPPRGERRPTPPPVTHPTLGGRLGHREGVGENDARTRKGKEPAASRSGTRLTIERDTEGRPRAMERRGDLPPPPPRGERYPTPPPVTQPTLGDRLGHREGVGENDARHRIDRLARSLALEEEDAVGPPCFGPRIRDEPFPKGFSLPRDTPKYNGSVKPED